MTKVFVTPVIRREDYDAFRRDVGSTLAHIYDEFKRYCRTAGKKPDPLVLLEFAAHRPLGEA